MKELLKKSSVFQTGFAALLFALLLSIFFSEFLTSPDQLMLNSDQLNGLGTKYKRAESLILPQWDDSRVGGIPTLDAMYGDAYHPLAILHFMMDPARAVGFKFIFTIWIAFLSGFILFRRLTADWKAGGLLATLFALNPQFFSHVYGGHDGKMMVVAVAPLAIWAAGKIIQSSSLLATFILGLSLTWMMLTSHLQITYFFLWGLLFYTLFENFFLNRSIALKIKLGRQLLIGLALIAALFAASFQIWPPYQYTTTQSVRGSGEKTNIGHAVSWSLHPEEVMSAFLPSFMDTDVQKEQKYWGHNSFKLNHDAPGFLLLILGVLGIGMQKNRWRAGFWVTGITICFVYATGAHTPFFKLFFEFVPGVKNFRAPAMVIFWVPLALAVLAAPLLRKPDDKQSVFANLEKSIPWYLPWIAIVSGVVILARMAWPFMIQGAGVLITVVLWLLWLAVYTLQQEQKSLSITNIQLAIKSKFSGINKARLVLMSTPFLFLLFLFWPSEPLSQPIIANYFSPLKDQVRDATLGASIFNSLFWLSMIASVWILTQKKNLMAVYLIPILGLAPALSLIPGLTLVPALLISGALGWLVWFYSGKLDESDALITRLILLGVAGTMFVNAPYIQNIPEKDYIQPENPWVKNIYQDRQQDTLNDYRVFPLTRNPLFSGNIFPLYGLRNAGGFHDNEIASYREFRGGNQSQNLIEDIRTLMQNGQHTPFLDLLNIRYILLDGRQGLQLLPHRTAMPRTTLFHSVQKTPRENIISTLKKPDFDYRNILLVDSDAKVTQSYPAAEPPSLSPAEAKIVQELQPGTEFLIQTSSPKPAVMMFSENWHPYWKASLDGKSVNTLQVNYTLLGVEVPAGDHEIRLIYDSDAIASTKPFAIAGSLLLFLLLISALLQHFVFNKKTLLTTKKKESTNPNG